MAAHRSHVSCTASSASATLPRTRYAAPTSCGRSSSNCCAASSPVDPVDAVAGSGMGGPGVALVLEALAGEAERRVGPAVEVLQRDRRRQLDDRGLAEVLEE